MFYFQLLVVVGVVGGIAWVALGRGGEIGEVHSDRPDLTLPGDRAVESEDVDRLRFSVGVRGYRMDEVDGVLDRLTEEIVERDRRIAELTEAVGAARASGGVPDGTQQQPPQQQSVAAWYRGPAELAEEARQQEQTGGEPE